MNFFASEDYADEVLAALGEGWVEARLLRKRLNAPRWWLFRWSAPGFYALMFDLELARVIERRRAVSAFAGCLMKTYYRRRDPAS